MTTAIESIRKRLSARSIRSESGCLEWQGAKNQYGYGVIGAGIGSKTILAHRAAWLIHYGEMNGLHVLHRCDNPKCVEITHLFLGTPADNCADKISKGRMRWGTWPHKGECNPLSRLTEAQAIAIKQSQERQTEIAASFGVSQQTVSDIKCGRRWAHLGETV